MAAPPSGMGPPSGLLMFPPRASTKKPSSVAVAVTVPGWAKVGSSVHCPAGSLVRKTRSPLRSLTMRDSGVATTIESKSRTAGVTW